MGAMKREFEKMIEYIREEDLGDELTIWELENPNFTLEIAETPEEQEEK